MAEVKKMPRWAVAAVLMGLFALALFAVREYALGATSHLTLALGAGLVCLLIVGGLIYANYQTYTSSNGDHAPKW